MLEGIQEREIYLTYKPLVTLIEQSFNEDKGGYILPTLKSFSVTRFAKTSAADKNTSSSIWYIPAAIAPRPTPEKQSN